MEAPVQKVKIRSSYNLFGLSFTPDQIFNEIRRNLSGFKNSYLPDFRQAIADSWPNSIDDSRAREDWGWEEQYGLVEMVKDMLEQLGKSGAYKLPEMEEESKS